MNLYTVLGFVAGGGNYVDFNLDIAASSPADALEKALKRHSNLVVSGVYRFGMDMQASY